MLQTLEFKQLLKSDIKSIWGFMSDPSKLAVITPKYMNFEILSDIATSKMYPGQIIEYYVRPVMNVKMHWVTEITHVKENEYFVDEQRQGPYKFWHHKHFLKETNEGVEMYDLIHYELPLGILGKIANEVFVKKQLQAVFDHRYRVLDKIFNK